MDFQIKLFRWPDRGNHIIIIIARGLMDVEGLKQLFREVAKTIQPFPDCKILIDLLDATHRLEPTGIDTLVNGLTLDRWPQTNKVALVSASAIDQYDHLVTLCARLSERGLKAAVFSDSKAAVDWLAEITCRK